MTSRQTKSLAPSKGRSFVIPAQAGIHVHKAEMDSRFRGNDEFQAN